MNASKKYFYAATFPYGRNCTTGEPNKVPGRMSMAARLHAFKTKAERDAFVDRNAKAEAFTKRGLRSLCLGATVENFAFDVRCAESDAGNRD